IIQGKVDSEAERLADKLLALFGIDHIAGKYPAEVSGGERQRTAVARSLINQPLLILADEPTGNLDSKSSRAVIESFENAREKLGASIFMVTHDSFAASFCDRVILLKDGMVYDTMVYDTMSYNDTVYDTLTADTAPSHMDPEEKRSAFQERLLGAIRKMSSMEPETNNQNKGRK
ncbi:MAG: ATP-binding cassette domain-containing protein, partial [Lachnospiraceae bacterium]|nr:ATP-binding cassette domain-containing protein [Lachnospiraceae bacterium]